MPKYNIYIICKTEVMIYSRKVKILIINIQIKYVIYNGYLLYDLKLTQCNKKLLKDLIQDGIRVVKKH